MAINYRSIIYRPFVEHLWLTSAKNGKTKFWRNRSGESFQDQTYPNAAVPMGGWENSFVHYLLKQVSKGGILNFKPTKDRRYSQWDISKVYSFPGQDTLLGQANSPQWGWDVYFRDEEQNRVSAFEHQLITHEIGHTLGLGHPNQKPYDPRYSQADTVMSYNPVFDNNNTTIKYGFTSSDNAALSALWGNSNFVFQRSTKPENTGDFKVLYADESNHNHDHNHFNVNNSRLPVYKLSGDNERVDLAKYWESNKDKITTFLENNNANNSPLVIRLDNDNNAIDLSDWSGQGLSDGFSTGHLLVKGGKGDDSFTLRGASTFDDSIFAKDLVISGGKGLDKIEFEGQSEFANAKTAIIAGSKAIRFYGEIEELEILEGAKIINADRQQGVIIRDDVEQITYNGKQYSFLELFDYVEASF